MPAIKRILACATLAASALFLQGCEIMSPRAGDTTIIQPDSWQQQLKSLSELQDWRIRGKIGYQGPDDAGSAYIDWIQSRDAFHITLSGPLGQGTTIISGDAQGARLESARDGVHLAASPEALLHEHTGITLPVSEMHHWIKGMPSPQQQQQTLLSPQNTLLSLQQEGWDISYADYKPALDNLLPTRIKMKGHQIKVTLVVKSWEPLPEDEE